MATEPLTAEIVPVADVGIVLMPVMNIQMARKRLAEFQEFVKEYLVQDEDFGIIPGTPRPTLLKPGADKLCELYGLADSYSVKEVENWQLEPPLFDYTVTCTLTSRRDQSLVSTGLGSCNSWEGKYKYRDSKRKCPLCNQETIIKGKEEYGGGWVCFKKKGGCGAKFPDTDKSITEQKVGKEINDDVPTVKNTILKMAKKRAKIDAVIGATRSSGIFSQDLEDIIEHESHDSGTRASAQRVAEKKIEELKAKKVETQEGQDGGDQLTLVQTGQDEYRISGDGIIMEGHKELLLRYGKRGKENGKPAPYVVMNADNLDHFRYEFETNRKCILTPLKATWAKS